MIRFFHFFLTVQQIINRLFYLFLFLMVALKRAYWVLIVLNQNNISNILLVLLLIQPKQRHGQAWSHRGSSRHHVSFQGSPMLTKSGFSALPCSLQQVTCPLLFQHGPQILDWIHIRRLWSPIKKSDPRMSIKPLLDFLACVARCAILHEDGATSLPEGPSKMLVEDIHIDILVHPFLLFRLHPKYQG